MPLILVGSAILIALGFTLRHFAGPMVSFHLEWLAASGWVMAAVAFFLHPQARLRALSTRMLLACAVPGSLLVLVLADTALGRAVYGERMIMFVLYLLAAAVAIWFGMQVALSRRSPEPAAARSAQQVLFVVGGGIALAAVLSAVAGVGQFFFWPWPDWLVFPLRDSGRVYGNLRQANHFALLMALGVVGVTGIVALAAQPLQHGRASLHRWGAVVVVALLGVACAMSASRMGMLMLWVIAAAAIAGKALPGVARVLPLCAAACHALAWNLFVWMDEVGKYPFYAVTRPMVGSSKAAVDGQDISGTRFDIWRGIVEVTQQQGWFGAGWGNMNHAYFIHDVTKRMSLNMQNAHNLVLQLAIEQGWLVTIAWTLLLVSLIWMARRAWHDVLGRVAILALLAAGIHANLEYPLWYSYFLLPTAFAFGLACATGMSAGEDSDGLVGVQADGTPVARKSVALLATLAFAVLAALWIDYSKILPLFQGGRLTVMQRLELGYRSHLFKNLVDYGVVANTPVSRDNALMHYNLSKRALKVRIDTSLLVNLALACTYLDKQEEATFYLRRMREISEAGYQQVLDKLTDDERAVLQEPIRRVRAPS